MLAFVFRIPEEGAVRMILVTGEDVALRPRELAGHAAADMRRHRDAIAGTRDFDEPVDGAGAMAFARKMARCSAACARNPSFQRLFIKR